MTKVFLVVLIVIHGLIHLIGFVKAFHPSTLKGIDLAVPVSLGMVWLLSAVLFLITAALSVLGRDLWWAIAIPAVVLSQVLIVLAWHDARFGTVANVIIVVCALLGYGSWNFRRMARGELEALSAGSYRKVAASERVVEKRRQGGGRNQHVSRAPLGTSAGQGENHIDADIISAADLERLPDVVRKWLESSQVIGKEMIRTVHLRQSGRMRTSPTGRWMTVRAEQWFRTDEPGFVWVADVKAAPGIHLAGRDSYVDGKGSMLIRLFSLFNVVDARGDEIDQGAMLRYLAEIVWFPTAALSSCIDWKQIDPGSARVTMNHGGRSVSGVFRFDDDGNVVSFEAKRYYSRKEGATLEDWLISIDPSSCAGFHGIRVPLRAEVKWKLEEGDFTWYMLEVEDIRYNIPIGE